MMCNNKIKDPILDEHECPKCGNVLRRRATPMNIMHDAEIKFCPFCGEKYNE